MVNLIGFILILFSVLSAFKINEERKKRKYASTTSVEDFNETFYGIFLSLTAILGLALLLA